MARIMCTQQLWRSLGHVDRPPLIVAEPLIHGVALGSWALKPVRFDQRELIMALNERTYLTLVFPLLPRDRFSEQFAEALRWALEDMGVRDDVIHLETAAVELLPMCRLNKRSLRAALNDVEYFCGLELEYISDLRRVQANLNECPHRDLEAAVPIEAVSRLFEAAEARRSFSSH
jgi:hypothetical protein